MTTPCTELVPVRRQSSGWNSDPTMVLRRKDRDPKLLDGAHLDLTDAFIRKGKSVRQFFKGGWRVLQAPLGKNCAFTRVQAGQGSIEQIATHTSFLAVSDDFLLAWCLIGQELEPLAVPLVFAASVQRAIAAA